MHNMIKTGQRRVSAEVSTARVHTAVDCSLDRTASGFVGLESPALRPILGEAGWAAGDAWKLSERCGPTKVFTQLPLCGPSSTCGWSSLPENASS